MTPPLELAEAQRRLLASVEPLGSEAVPVVAAAGRELAEPLVAKRTQPAADLSAMDGYAVRSGETGPWQVVGESAAGHPFAGELGAAEAIRISTGALMPAGADAVLLQENATRDGDALALNGEGEPSPRHIRRAGFDFRAGDPLLPAGTFIGAAQVALAYAAGHATLDVRKRPRVVAIDSGDELSPDPANCADHQIPMSNGAMIGTMAGPFAERVRLVGPVPDHVESLAGTLASFEDCDVIVTSGGASVGDHDVLRPALEAWGATIDFWRVALKPGKPLLVARKDGKVLLGLPGNPASSFVTAYLFLLPLLRRLSGMEQCLPSSVSALLTAPLAAGGSRVEFVRARLERGKVTPLGEQDSSALRSLAAANALIERPIDARPAASGEPVSVYPLHNGVIA